jgi:hypothetical protein
MRLYFNYAGEPLVHSGWGTNEVFGWTGSAWEATTEEYGFHHDDGGFYWGIDYYTTGLMADYTGAGLVTIATPWEYSNNRRWDWDSMLVGQSPNFIAMQELHSAGTVDPFPGALEKYWVVAP